MTNGPALSSPDALSEFVEAFEIAQNDQPDVDLSEFLPHQSHPLYGSILRELVRVDLEYRWQRGQPRPLTEYQDRFPHLRADLASLEEIAFEEYRLRCQAGQSTSPDEYRQRFGIDTHHWFAPDASAEANSDSKQGSTIPAGPPVVQDDLRDDLRIAARAYQAIRRVNPGRPQAELETSLRSLTGSTAHARLISAVYGRDPAMADRFAEAMAAMPLPGSESHGFRLIAELGRGTFGRVYLARQGDLAGRAVALKLSADLWHESQTLAQLQHTNIVPIYSLHRTGALQAVCMPLLGATTLADLLKELRARPALPTTAAQLDALLAEHRAKVQQSLPTGVQLPMPAVSQRSAQERSTPEHFARERTSYVNAVLEMAANLAEGLGHAHERGILHRDLKPANILLTPDGQPLLLDFNLAEDTKLRSALGPGTIGGTLGYMAPEHLEVFHTGRNSTDARSDLYSLGLIIGELLTGRMLFPLPKESVTVPQLIAERRQGPPPLGPSNKAISPAVESIIRKCLEPDPARRYQTARQLEEDLRQQLASRPLRYAPEPSFRERLAKWRRRHPRLSSAAGVAAMSAVLIAALAAALVVRNNRMARLEAMDTLHQFQGERQAIEFLFLDNTAPDSPNVEKAIARTRRLLGNYHVLDNPSWRDETAVRSLPDRERHRLEEEMGGVLLLWARVELLRATRQAAGQRETSLLAALDLNRRAESCYADAPPPGLWQQRAEIQTLLGRAEEAKQTLQTLRSKADFQSTARNLASLAGDHIFHNRYPDALPLLQQARRLDPADFWVWFDLGLCHEHLAQDTDAAACFGTCIALSPRFAPAHYKYGVARLRQGHHAEAVAAFDDAIRNDETLAPAWMDRGLAKAGLKQYDGAIADLSVAMQHGASPARVLLARARVRELAGDAEGARRDLQEGLRHEPTDEAGWIARGMARMAKEPDAAVKDFDGALALNPRSLAALQNKAHLLAQKPAGTADAIGVLNELIGLYPDYLPARAGRGVLYARLNKRPEAIRDAEICLARTDDPALLYQVACIFALTSRTVPDDRKQALQFLSAALDKGGGLSLVETDTDLDPLRGTPEFDKLLQAIRGKRSSR